MRFKFVGIIIFYIEFTFISGNLSDLNTNGLLDSKYDGKCFGKPDGYKYTDPTNCGQYYKCSAGQSQVRRCPPRFYFNEFKQECDRAKNVKCNIKTSSVEKRSLQDSKYDSRCFGQADGYKYTNPANCAEFFTCSAGQSYLQKCPAKLYFSQKEQFCDYVDNVSCNGIPAEPDCKNANNGDIFANPNDCTTFYVCNWQHPVLIKCDPGLNFDPSVNNCNWADLYKCPEAAIRP